LNPAITGSSFLPKACLTYQKQWAGIPQSPQSMLVSASIRIGNFDFYNPKKLVYTSRIKSRERIGLGISFFSDQNGPLTARGINAAYAYHVPFDHSQLSLAISGSTRQQIIDESVFRPTYPGDPIITGIRESFISYNATIGAYYYARALSGGLAIHNIIPLEDKLRPGDKVRPDLVLHGSYLFSSFGKPNMEIRMNIRYLDMAILEYDLHVRTYIREVHWIALSYRSYQALALHLGFNISRFYLAYSFETTLSSMVRYQMGTHAVHLGINLGMKSINY